MIETMCIDGCVYVLFHCSHKLDKLQFFSAGYFEPTSGLTTVFVLDSDARHLCHLASTGENIASAL